MLLLSLFYISCDNTVDDTIYFGGQIINPKTDHVILWDKETALDTFYLSENNRFAATLKNIKEGLYYFRHDDEYQYIYLEPKDSLLIRLNTLNFDESLVFSGKGAERNNFLLDCFINAENDNRSFYNYYKLKPDQFIHKIDALEAKKISNYNEFSARNNDETEDFLTFLKVAITYPIYSKIENYPLNNARILKKKSLPKTDEDFYKHRKQVNFNSESLIYYGVYSNYLTNYLYNKTYADGFKPSVKDYSPKFTKKFLEITESNIQTESTKNILLNQQIKYHFFKNSRNIIYKDVFKTYFKLNTNKDLEKQIQNLIADADKIKKGDKIPHFIVYDYLNKSIKIEDLIKDKNTFIYFWNPKHISENFISMRVNYLASKYNNVQYIGVKIDGDDTNHNEKLDIKSQYYINTTSDANIFLTSKLPRVIMIDKNGMVTNSYASISSRKIYSQVKTLNKK